MVRRAYTALKKLYPNLSQWKNKSTIKYKKQKCKNNKNLQKRLSNSESIQI